jgi:dolichol-phosphate mannosyltransferase
MSRSLVLVPTYNERENLPRVLPLLAALEEEVNVLVIDDASPDGTGTLAEELRGRYPRLSVLHRRAKEGLGRAYVHGFRVAIQEGYSRIVTMDADLSHAPEDVPRLLQALEEADVAIGSRHVPGGRVEDWPWSRRLLSRAGSLYARTLLRIPVSDVTSGFRAYRAETLRALDLEAIAAQGFVFQVEILRRILDLPGTRAVEVPIVFRNRAHGRSKLSGGIIAEAAREVAALAFRRKPLPERQCRRIPSASVPEPLVSVVIPAPAGGPLPEAVRGLSALAYPREKLEVVVARGSSPSRQRNLAAQATAGEFILFLDDDSEASPDLLENYLSVFERDPTVAAVGGPAVPRPGSLIQEAASSVLAEPWVVGRNAARFRPRGRVRFTDERELILCNLCLRRSALESAGGFNEALYPNEENELLERLRLSGWRLVHHPEALVRRPQRETLPALLRAVSGYGAGRAAQTRCLPSRVSLARTAWVALGLAAAAVSLAALALGAVAMALPLGLYGLYLAALGLRLSFRDGLRRGSMALAVAILVHWTYASGLLMGLLHGHRARVAGEVVLERMELSGEAQRRRSCA